MANLAGGEWEILFYLFFLLPTVIVTSDVIELVVAHEEVTTYAFEIDAQVHHRCQEIQSRSHANENFHIDFARKCGQLTLES